MRKYFIVVFTMVVMIFAFNDIMAQGIGFSGIGGRLGFVNPEGSDNSTIFFGGHADLGTVIPSLVLFPSLEFSRKNGVTLVALNGDFRYYIPVPGNTKPFLGGGLAILYTNGSGFSDTDVGLDLLGGADFPLAPNLNAFAKLKYTISDNSIFRLTGGITIVLIK